jgi:hypothetical protein
MVNMMTLNDDDEEDSGDFSGIGKSKVCSLH